MKKRNFILDFALKSKYNFLACVVALLVLIFSVSSITYAWIEGATQITIPASATVYSGTDKAIKITADTTNAKTISLDSYIDPQNVYLAPASGAFNSTTKLIDVAFNSRPADTNDIGNNYLFFEAKVQCVGLVTDLAFDSSYIKIGESVPGDIRVGITLLDADRTALSSKIFTAQDVADGKNAVDGLTANGVYILQFKIWNETTEAPNVGQELNIDLNLVPKKAITTFTLVDYTNNATNDGLLKSAKLVSTDGNITIGPVNTKNADREFVFDEVPESMLGGFKVVASDGTKEYTWSLENVEKAAKYKVYGDPSKSYGTFGTVQKVTVNDVSAGNILGSETVSVNNGIDGDPYVMYKASSTEFTAYVPATTQNVTFTSDNYTASDAFDSATSVLNVYGHELPDADPDTLTPCVTEWSGAKPSELTKISIKDMSQGSVVKDLRVYASYGSLTTPYNAYFDAESNSWKITAISSYLASGSTGEVWNFYAYEAGSTTLKYSWTDPDTNARPLGVDASKTYYFTSSTAGTWEYKGSSIDPAILTDEKVSFYAGVDTDWDRSTGLYISEIETLTESGITQSYKQPFLSVKSSSRTYSSGYFTNVASYNYFLKHQTTWKGIQIGEDAVAGKFYGLYKSEQDTIETVDAVTGTTTIGNESSSLSDSPASVAITADENYTFQTNTNNYGKSLLRKKISDDQYEDINLYVEYHICEKGHEAGGFICLNPYISGDSSSTKITSSDTDENTITTKVISLAGFDTAKTYTIKTVLTDGYIYYVSDTDYIKFTDSSQNHNLTVYKPSTTGYPEGSVAVVDDSVDVTVTYNGNEYSGTESGAEITNVPNGSSITLNSSVSNAKFNSYSVSGFVLSDGTTTKTFDNGASTTVSNEYLENIDIKAKVAYKEHNFYLKGENIDSLTAWSTSAEMVYDANTNSVSTTIKYNDKDKAGQPLMFKIMRDKDSELDNADYCVNYNGNFDSSKLIVIDGLNAKFNPPDQSGNMYSNIGIFGLDKSTQVLVTYKLGTGVIVLSKAGSTPTPRTITVNDTSDGNGHVILTIGDKSYFEGSENGNTVQLDPDTEVTLTCIVKNGDFTSKKGNFNSYSFQNFTATVANGLGATVTTIGNTSTTTYKVPDSDATISATLKQSDNVSYYLTGQGMAGINWNANPVTYKDISDSYKKTDNTVSATVTANSNTVKFKISKDGADKRDEEAYSVTLNKPTVTSLTDGLTAALDPEPGDTVDKNTVVILSGITSGDELTITYNLGTHTITVAKTGSATPTTKRIYIDTSEGGWFTDGEAKPAINYAGLANDYWIDLDNQTETIGGKVYFYCDIPVDATDIKLSRHAFNGHHNVAAISTPSSDQNLFTVAKNWTDTNPNGIWSKLDTTGGGEVTTKNRIYFNDTLSWGSVYVNFYSSAYWDKDKGSGNIDKPYRNNAMKSLGNNIYYLDIPEGATDYNIVSFTKDSQENHQNFWKTQAVYRSDFNTSTTAGKLMFVPSTNKSTTLNQTDYYNEGNWVASPE